MILAQHNALPIDTMPFENDLAGNTGKPGWHPPYFSGGVGLKIPTPISPSAPSSPSSPSIPVAIGSPIVMPPITSAPSSPTAPTVGGLPGIRRPPIDAGAPAPVLNPTTGAPVSDTTVPPGTPIGTQEPAPPGTGTLLPAPSLSDSSSLAQLLSSQNTATAQQLAALAATASNGGINEQLGPQQTYVNATTATNSPSSPANQQRGVVVIMIALAVGVGIYFYIKHKKPTAPPEA